MIRYSLKTTRSYIKRSGSPLAPRDIPTGLPFVHFSIFLRTELINTIARHAKLLPNCTGSGARNKPPLTSSHHFYNVFLGHRCPSFSSLWRMTTHVGGVHF